MRFFSLGDGNWGQWGDYGPCSSSCEQQRVRLCDNPKPRFGGQSCFMEGQGRIVYKKGLIQIKSCKTDDCIRKYL